MKLLGSLRGFFDPLKAAKKILGPENVLTAKQLGEALGLNDPGDCPMLYPKNALTWCAEENAKGEEWKLVPKLCLSLVEMKQRSPKSFFESSVWHTLPSWATSKCRPGYRLVNFNLSFCADCPYLLKGEREISFAPARVQTVAGALVGFPNGTLKHLKGAYHAGGDYRGITPVIGSYKKLGMHIYTLPTSAVPDLISLKAVGRLWCVVPNRS